MMRPLRTLTTALVGGFLLSPVPTQAAQPVEALMAAMELDMSQVVTSSITSGLETNMFDVRSSLGVVSPYNAPTFAVLSTGDVNNITAMMDHDYPDSGIPDTSVGDRAFLAFDIEVPQFANSFSFNFYFLSREYPEWVGSNYNDTFEVTLDSNAYQGQIVFDAFGNPVTVNNALFSVVNPAQLTGTGFDADGGTGWVTTIAPCQAGETMHIQFEIYDVADGVWDSAVLIDNFQFSENQPPEDGPWTGDDTPDVPLEIGFLSPKEGDLAGGYEILVHGSGFDNTVSVVVDGSTLPPANVTVGTGGETLSIEGWPAANGEGPVDVVLRKGLEEVVLGGGFTYWDVSGGSMPPRITSVQPSEANPGGGTDLRIRGTGFIEGATISFVSYDDEGNGISVPAAEGLTLVELEGGAQELSVLSPLYDINDDGNGDGGWADLVVTNPSGLETDPGYPYLFTGDAPATTVDGGGNGRGGCTLAPRSQGWSLALLFGLIGIALRARRVEVVR